MKNLSFNPALNDALQPSFLSVLKSSRLSKCFTYPIWLIFSFCFNYNTQAQTAPAIDWQKSLGGSDSDQASSIRQTTDGGFIVAGGSSSNGGSVSGNHGSIDYWIVMLDADGNLVWKKCFGGSGADDAGSIQQTTDDGFIVTGVSFSNDGDVSGHHGDTYYQDCWIVKLDGDGNLVWQKSLGGTDRDGASSIQQTSDGGFIVAGYSYSNDGDVSGHHGTSYSDCWIVKLDADGNLDWQKSLGGSDYDGASSIKQTSDGGFIVAGYSASNDGDVSGNHGGYDSWIVKLDADGNLAWQKSSGGSDYDSGLSIQQITDSGFIVAGYSYSNDGDVSGNHGYEDYWIMKLDADGNLVWQKSLGGSDFDEAHSIRQTTDGGFIVAGYSDSNDGDVSGNHGVLDYWIVKLDANGNLIWQKCLGGSDYDGAYSIQQTTDGGFIVAGFSTSIDGDVSGNHDGADYWIVKLSPVVGISELEEGASTLSIFPNPTDGTFSLLLNLSEEENAEATIEVLNLLGQIIITENGKIEKGKMVREIQLSDGATKAMYLVKVRINNQVYSAEFNLQN